MDNNDLILNLRKLINEYHKIRNNKIRILVYDLNRVSGNNFLRHPSISLLINNNPEIKKLLESKLKLAQKDLRIECKKNQNGKKEFIDIKKTYENLTTQLNNYISTRNRIKETVGNLYKNGYINFLEDTRIKNLLVDSPEIKNLLEYYVTHL